MSQKMNLIEKVTLYPSETTYKFGKEKEFEFQICQYYKKDSDNIYYKIQKTKGDFEILKILQGGESMIYNKLNNTVLLSVQKPRYLTFYISANIPVYETTNDDEYNIIGYDSEYNEEDSICESEMNQTRLESVLSSPFLRNSSFARSVNSPFLKNNTPVLKKRRLNESFCEKSNISDADVIFRTSDDKEIPATRKVLTEFSNILPQILKQTPTYLNVSNFTGDTIQAAIDFMNGNINAIKGKEFEVCKFAVTYDIQKLINACRLSFEKSVNPSNVCEIIQIAYSDNFEELKQKCLEVLIENKNEIGKSQIAKINSC
uniref:BTB domain-containing protein n=1 Tax=Panagrolaimus sp. PS1159 TaxID=55785 RepID=A0AC35FSL0_9BILA